MTLLLFLTQNRLERFDNGGNVLIHKINVDYHTEYHIIEVYDGKEGPV
jgi:hypothetical protein